MTMTEFITTLLPSDPLWITILVILPLTAWYFFLSSPEPDLSNIPWAPGAIPLLGHAILYRKDPSGFLVRTCEQVGSVFQLNLAGKRMYVVCGPWAQKIIAMAPESQLSARQAVADIGFEQTLGHRNVHQGTDIHKGIVKGVWLKNPSEQVQGWMESVQAALEKEIRQDISIIKVDFFNLLRRVVLRATIERLIGPTFLDDWDYNFLDKFMSFQDALEDVTAKSVVLPRWLTLPTMLLPFQRRRETMQSTIAQHLKEVLQSKAEMGFWLKEVHDNYSEEEIAEYIVGLLFAAHKNPAIGAAQAYLLLIEQGTKEDQDMCFQESKKLVLSPDWSTLQSCTKLRRVCQETLRLTAHSIGGIRTAQRDFPIGDRYLIPKGSSVALAHIASSLNPKIWDDPLKLDTMKHSDDLYQDEYLFTTFSHGVHKCPGQQVALAILQCTLAILLQGYDIKLPKNIAPLSFERATLAQREGPVRVSIRRKD